MHRRPLHQQHLPGHGGLWGQWPEGHKVTAEGYRELGGQCSAGPQCGGPWGLGTVPTAALSIPCWSPSHWQGCQLRDPLCFGSSHPEINTIGFHFHQNVAFLHFIFAFRSETKISPEAQTWSCTTNSPSQPGGSTDAAGLPALPAQRAMLGNFPH